jgi:hypothetical protein
LRHCATNRKVAGSILDGVTGIFHWHNPVGCTMALGLTQPLTEMSTRNISWGVNAAVAYGRHPATFMCRLSRNLGASTSWTPLDLSRPVMGVLFFLRRRIFYNSVFADLSGKLLMHNTYLLFSSGFYFTASSLK